MGLVWQGVDSSHFSTSDQLPAGWLVPDSPFRSPEERGERSVAHRDPALDPIVHAVTPVNEVLIDPN